MTSTEFATRIHRIARTDSGGVTYIIMSGELDLAAVGDIASALTNPGDMVVVDMRAVTFLDCSALEALLAGTDGVKRALKTSPAVDRLLSLTGDQPALGTCSRAGRYPRQPAAGNPFGVPHRTGGG